MYTGVAAYLEFCGLRLRDMYYDAVPVGVSILAMNCVYSLMMMMQMHRNM
jgi:hypothetical protein